VMGLVAQAVSHLQAVFRRGAIPHLFAAYGRHQLEIAPAGNVVGPAKVNQARKVAYLMRIPRRKFIEKRHSDASVWKGKQQAAAMQAMKQAASPQQYKQRIEDVQIVLTALAKENANPKSNLFRKMDLSKVGMSGHSFGAKTTQAVSGESFIKRVATAAPQTVKIAAALPMSPSPSARQPPEESFGSVSIPWLCMTGTEDGGPTWLVDTKPTDRLKVFEALPKTGHMYELVLFGAEHSAFTQKGKNPNHHRSILATSTAFWDAYLRGNPSAQEWLKQSAPNVLDKNDVWRFK